MLAAGTVRRSLRGAALAALAVVMSGCGPAPDYPPHLTFPPRADRLVVRVPTALPFLLTAMKSCVVLALIGVIVTEVVTGFTGVGFVIVASLGAFQTVQGWLALLTVAAVGITWYLLIEGIERVVVPWETANRRGDS